VAARHPPPGVGGLLHDERLCVGPRPAAQFSRPEPGPGSAGGPHRDVRGQRHRRRIGSPNVTTIEGDNPPQTLATAMHRARVEFMTHGDSGSTWPRYTLDKRETMIRNTPSFRRALGRNLLVHW
jgi:hypothetical protein